MIHTLYNLPEKYDVILDGLENYLMSIDNDALPKEIIREKLNYMHEKIKNENEEKKKKKEKDLAVYGR